MQASLLISLSGSSLVSERLLPPESWTPGPATDLQKTYLPFLLLTHPEL